MLIPVLLSLVDKNFSIYLARMSVSIFTKSPLCKVFKFVFSKVCGITAIVTLSPFTSATVRLIPLIVIEPFFYNVF